MNQPRDLSAIIPPSSIRNSPDERANHELEFFKAQIADIRQNTEERRLYSGKIYRLIVGWLGVVLVIVLLEGFRVCGFKWPDHVLGLLCGSTTLGVVGTLTIVVRYLFSRRE